MNYAQATQCALLSEEIYQEFSQIQFSHFPNITPVLIDKEDTGTQCAILLDSTEDAIYIVFRGSEEKIDWSTNFDLNKVIFEENVIHQEIVDKLEEVYPYEEKSQSGAKMHQGFVNAYLSVREEIHHQIKNYTASKVIVTGHSLGGRVSSSNLVSIVLDQEIKKNPSRGVEFSSKMLKTTQGRPSDGERICTEKAKSSIDQRSSAGSRIEFGSTDDFRQ